MCLAGYGGLSKRNRYFVASRIVQRYESGVGDGRKILRAAGLGEIAIAQKIIELMKCESKTVQVRACELAAKCLGMTQEQGGTPIQGMTIIIKGTEQTVQVNAGGAPPRPTSCGQVPGGRAVPAPTPICITK
jgi:hypothetical protein